jgi:hypothetical protein
MILIMKCTYKQFELLWNVVPDKYWYILKGSDIGL